MLNFSEFDFAPVMNYPKPEKMKVFDFTKGYDADYICSFEWGIGKYDEKRHGMYTTAQFEGTRNIHMGIDIWSQAGEPVFSFTEGEICYVANNDQAGDYGPTIVARYKLGKQTFYALFGHLSLETLNNIMVGEVIRKGQQIATIGPEKVNGGWAPHLHFQLAVDDPGKANMPGVVAEEDHQKALEKFPDPRLVLGNLYD